MQSRKPIGSLASMAGAGRPMRPAACFPGKTAGHSWLSISPKCALLCMPMGRPLSREGHGSGEGRGTSPGEVHDIALKAAETDGTKRALATFGKPFGLELYRKDKDVALQSSTSAASAATASPPTHRASVSTPTIRRRSRGRRITTDDGIRARRLSCYAGIKQKRRTTMRQAPRAKRLQRPRRRTRQNRQKPARDRRTQAPAR